ncbi:hypothetical protein ATS73_011080 [Pseudoalteromonas sp. H100]|nr:hypothetical protein [Pseudoalteromonas sp. H100]WFO18649.1 hypothetical protein ATS73_011080 [Pseudoalteromonas sp. H100]
MKTKQAYTQLSNATNKASFTACLTQKEYATELAKAADLLRQASKLADNKEFANYLNLRADALQKDDFQVSDFAWMDMKNNPIDVVIGPIETYEDQLFGYRTAYESYVLIKDLKWSERLAKFAAFLPELQKRFTC